ncbi:MAG: bifunctional methionine sulfoxide reductase B/A protein [Candidatus Omnitrophica bacterium]|nr:bifunctional methionine sulfoxide reductase B/A protein [Candidatus Omnitrophota bacterium]
MRYLRILAIFFLFPWLLGGVMGEPPKEKIKIFNARTKQIEEVEKVIKTNQEWEKILTPEQYHIMRLKGTEEPFKESCLLPPKGKGGIYQCAGCGADLFMYNAKFESQTGWPSFWEPVSQLNIRIETDNSLGSQRSEVLCARCDAHLGHVFDDGPLPTGKRYCINALALKLAETEEAAFAAGCFWGTEAVFNQVKGVINVSVGFMGGHTKNPSYEEVSTANTGHAETVRIEYDPGQVSYEKLLDIFWSIHNPTTPNRQGPDIGSQYRSIIFYYTPEQEKASLLSKKKLEKTGGFVGPIVTEIAPAQEFYKAEDYHQNYYQKHGIKPTCHIPSGLKK